MINFVDQMYGNLVGATWSSGRVWDLGSNPTNTSNFWQRVTNGLHMKVIIPQTLGLVRFNVGKPTQIRV